MKKTRLKIAFHIGLGLLLFTWAGLEMISEFPRHLSWNISGVFAGVLLLFIGTIDLVAFIRMRKRVKEVFSEMFHCDICEKDRPIEKKVNDGMCEDCLPF